jgi:anti-sigma factor ChrR (cupin superfamily)
MAEMSIGKLDAARRQLETAVHLYFSESDPVAIHTLTAAGHQLLSDLNKSRAGTPMFVESILQRILPDQVGEAKRRINKAANSFKHADRDPGQVHLFDPDQTEFMLVDACYKYKDLTGELVPALVVYTAWFWLGPGAKFVDVTQTKSIDQFRAAFPGETKGSFFKKVLPMVSRLAL